MLYQSYKNSWSRKLSFLMLSICVGLSIGCGSESVKLVPASGRVTVNGKPLTAGTVTFRPDKSKGNTFGGEPMGELNSEGVYTIETNGKPGAPLGSYKVTIMSSGPTTEDNTKVKAQSLVNMTYFHADTTPLTIEVVQQPAAGAYDLKLTP
jgi:hypothetical protein